VETLVQLSIYKACVVLCLFFTCDFVCILLYYNVLYFLDLESVIKVSLIDETTNNLNVCIIRWVKDGGHHVVFVSSYSDKWFINKEKSSVSFPLGL